MKRYLALWSAITAALIISVMLVNAVVDPYGLYRLVDAPGFNAVKPKAGPHGGMVKAYGLLRARPRTLILGNSRAEVGFDPSYSVWPADARPVFNLALPGTGPATALAYLQHALAAAADDRIPRIVTIVWGLDFADFLTDSHLPVQAAAPSRPDRRLLAALDGTRNSSWWLQRLRDYGEATLTLGAAVDSIQTLVSQRDPAAADLTPLGFNPMGDYVRITSEEGYRGTFQQKDIDNMRAYLRRPKDVFGASGKSSADLDDFHRVLDLCRRNGIELKLVIYPVHAHLLEIIRLTGHWPAFETWKRAMVEIVADEARAAQAQPFPIWDFGGFSHYVVEQIPKSSDRRTKMQWYWEAGHFKRELGNRVLDRVFNAPGADPTFGVRLDTINADAQIASMRSGELDYRRHFPEEIEALDRIEADLRPHR